MNIEHLVTFPFLLLVLLYFVLVIPPGPGLLRCFLLLFSTSSNPFSTRDRRSHLLFVYYADACARTNKLKMRYIGLFSNTVSTANIKIPSTKTQRSKPATATQRPNKQTSSSRTQVFCFLLLPCPFI